MLIGLVGKPNCGKSTFFKAATLADVLIANYPFATIKPNHGVGYVKIKCVEGEYNVRCKPNHGFCSGGWRFVPVELMDVAGLIEGSSDGKGLGNHFLDELRQADAFIHIVDASGETDAEGKKTEGYDPAKDIKMLENELDLWYLGILQKVWKAFAKKAELEQKNLAQAIAKQFSGLKVKEDDVKDVLRKLNFNQQKPSEWSDGQLKEFAHELRHLTKPMLIAANKIDVSEAEENLKNLKKAYPNLIIIPCSAESELALKEADSHGLIKYIPGEGTFQINKEKEDKINERQKQALELIKKKVLDVYGSTGIQEILNKVVFDILNYVAVFPVENATHLSDKKGNILPDCFLMPPNSSPIDLAYTIHTDIGKNFVKAVDVKTKKAISKDYKLKHLDIIEIMTR